MSVSDALCRRRARLIGGQQQQRAARSCALPCICPGAPLGMPVPDSSNPLHPRTMRPWAETWQRRQHSACRGQRRCAQSMISTTACTPAAPRAPCSRTAPGQRACASAARPLLRSRRSSTRLWSTTDRANSWPGRRNTPGGRCGARHFIRPGHSLPPVDKRVLPHQCGED